MKFTDENGEPKLIKHNCLPDRVGKPISEKELHIFGIELLTALYESEGIIIKDVNRVEGVEYP